nr:glycoside hydrolase family 32 protein [Paludisphaera mucosa]
MREEGWLNDLNGLVYYDGEYHLFAQRWNKCWIHAVSRDLVRWTELEPAFWEEALDVGVQSGTCVVDYANSSGLSPDPATPPMVAFWTRNDNRSHGIAFSLDHGRTWKYGPRNPVLVKPERDPMVFRHKPTQKWVMIMYGEDKYHVLTSDNLLDWKDEKRPIANSFECPDFFELAVAGDPATRKWALIRGDGRYSLGSFDGSEFREETAQFESDGGPNFYATQTWGNVETGDGRRIQAAWMRGGAYPDMPFNQQVTFPRELTLRPTPAGLRLFREPVREIATLHRDERKFEARILQAGERLALDEPGDALHIKMDVAVPEGATLTLRIRGVPLVLGRRSIACKSGPQAVAGDLEAVEVLIDRTSIEAFANHGEASTSTCFLPAGDEVAFEAAGGPATIRALSVFRLEGIWDGRAAK